MHFFEGEVINEEKSKQCGGQEYTIACFCFLQDVMMRCETQDI